MEEWCLNMLVMAKEGNTHTHNCYLFVGPSWLYCRNNISKNKDHQTVTKTDNTELGSVLHIWQTKNQFFFKLYVQSPEDRKSNVTCNVSLYTKHVYDKIKCLKYAAILLIMSKLQDLPFDLPNPTVWSASK